ncbi:MAG TPA: WD40 repeat domain-containing protein, partial [Thermoanaerobaculia bacterium]|nr:WD40 repeat domain-containing protein [Thermoanaerobaculia bacterium]
LEAVSGLSTSEARSGAAIVSRRRVAPKIALPAAAAAAAAALALGWLAARLARPAAAPAPVFRQLTFRRGFIGSGRFTPDGQSVVFSAQWDGLPPEVFLKRPETPDALSLQLPPAEVLAVSSAGQAAISLGCKQAHNGACAGTLAVVPLTGGAPRPLEDGIQWADWTPDGASMLVEHDVDAKARLEFPAGKVLYETTGHVSWPRFSPDGRTIAFLDHPFPTDDQGAVAMIDLAGKKTKLSRSYESVQGLAWSPDGKEIWFTAAEAGAGRSLRAVSLSGKERVLSNVPGGLTLRDISKTGRVLITHDNVRKGIMGLGPGQTKERELSWLDWSLPYDLSDDGTTLLLDEQGQAVGESYAVCLRKTDGSPVIRLGDGVPRSLSPDGKWAVTSLMKKHAALTLLPTGTGQPRALPSDGKLQFNNVRWLPDSRRIVFTAQTDDGTRRLYVQDIQQGLPRAITPQNARIAGFMLSADGKYAIYGAGNGTPATVSIDGGTAPPPPKIDLTNLQAIRFSGDGRYLFARDFKIPADVYRIDVATGRKELVRELSPGDPAGLQFIGGIYLSADGRSYVYGYTRSLSDLFAVDGFR